MSYKDLNIYQKAFQLAVDVHRISFLLPKYELYELGSQTRRAAQSIRANIAEGYGRRKYGKEYIRFLIFSHASADELSSHLEMLVQLYDYQELNILLSDSYELGKMLNNFIKSIEKRTYYQ